MKVLFDIQSSTSVGKRFSSMALCSHCSIKPGNGRRVVCKYRKYFSTLLLIISNCNY